MFGSDLVASPEVVELLVPAVPRHIRLARLTASGFVSDLGFTVDEVEEVRLAVDEACAVLIEHATADARLHLTYQVDDHELVIGLRCPCSGGDLALLDPIARAVLDTTLDTFEVYNDGGEANVLRLVKRVSNP